MIPARFFEPALTQGDTCMKNICFSHIRRDFSFARAANAAGLLALFAVALLSVGCATPTAVSRETTVQPNEGVAVMRVVNISGMKVWRIEVIAEASQEKFSFVGTQFGQTDSTTFVGRLPAGRYQPHKLFGSEGLSHIEAPLEKLTGKFDVEASRITDLATMIYLPETRSLPLAARELNTSGRGSFRFSLPLDPTPVPTEQLLALRFPAIAAVMKGRSSLGWVDGTVPRQTTPLLDSVSKHAAMTGTPVFLGEGRSVAAGQLGTVVDRGATPYSWTHRTTGVVHQLEAITRLKDGRWMVGGEEGYLAMADTLQGRWNRLPGLSADEVVVSLLQGPDDSVYMVTMNDAGSTVYQSTPDTINWRVIRRIEGERSKMNFQTPMRLRNSAAISRERLVVSTLPDTISSMDFRTGKWENYETPRPLVAGIKVTADGYLTGTLNGQFRYGSEDHGKTWRRQEMWLIASLSDFSERNKGMMISATRGMTIGKYLVRKTEDGGKTWSVIHEVENERDWIDMPFWIDPIDKSGKNLYALRFGRIYNSTDMGATWK